MLKVIVLLALTVGAVAHDAPWARLSERRDILKYLRLQTAECRYSEQGCSKEKLENIFSEIQDGAHCNQCSKYRHK